MEAIHLLTDESRNKRSIISANPNAFNIGCYNKQIIMELVVNNLEADQITTQRELIGMRFIIMHPEKKIEQLQKSAARITDLL